MRIECECGSDTDTVAVKRIRAYNGAHGDTEPDDA
jgi:hypothetical protein